VLEADAVLLLTDEGRQLPARVVAYDVATGFGLVQALAPLAIAPVPLGSAAAITAEDSLAIVSGGLGGAVSPARLVARRAFSGYWEYHLDAALFTAPPRTDHSGAALIDAHGRLLGIGSLFVGDAAGAEAPAQPGNMFVPIDLMVPILPELRREGRSRASARAWIGLNCVEQGGQVRVVRVSEDSPADAAGLERGDRIVGIDGRPVARLEELWKGLWADPRPERAVRLEVERGGERRSFTLQAVDREKTLRRPQGV
jgi:S1-C subfamily serine protease